VASRPIWLQQPDQGCAGPVALRRCRSRQKPGSSPNRHHLAPKLRTLVAGGGVAITGDCLTTRVSVDLASRPAISSASSSAWRRKLEREMFVRVLRPLRQAVGPGRHTRAPGRRGQKPLDQIKRSLSFSHEAPSAILPLACSTTRLQKKASGDELDEERIIKSATGIRKTPLPLDKAPPQVPALTASWVGADRSQARTTWRAAFFNTAPSGACKTLGGARRHQVPNEPSNDRCVVRAQNACRRELGRSTRPMTVATRFRQFSQLRLLPEPPPPRFVSCDGGSLATRTPGPRGNHDPFPSSTKSHNFRTGAGTYRDKSMTAVPPSPPDATGHSPA
jgi:hypothetical protein